MKMMETSIYIVEPNEGYRNLLVKQFEDVQKNVQVFTDGSVFLERLTSKPALIILDYYLDGDMNGYDVLRALKKLPFECPVIFFSKNLDLSITSSILKLGVVEYIQKTIFFLPRLQACVNKVLQSTVDN